MGERIIRKAKLRNQGTGSRKLREWLVAEDIYHRKWPTLMADRMSHQIEKLKHCEMGIVAFDDDFKQSHREAGAKSMQKEVGANWIAGTCCCVAERILRLL